MGRLERVMLGCVVATTTYAIRANGETSACYPMDGELFALDRALEKADAGAGTLRNAPGHFEHRNEAGLPLDKWGRPYVVVEDGGRRAAISTGRNGVAGDHDDVKFVQNKNQPGTWILVCDYDFDQSAVPAYPSLVYLSDLRKEVNRAAGTFGPRDHARDLATLLVLVVVAGAVGGAVWQELRR